MNDITCISWSAETSQGVTNQQLVNKISEGSQVFIKIIFDGETQEAMATNLMMRAGWKRMDRERLTGAIVVNFRKKVKPSIRE